MRVLPVLVLLLPLLVPPGPVAAGTAPDEVVDPTLGLLRGMIERYAADRGSIERFYDAPISEAALERESRFHRSWLARLDEVDFDALDLDARVDHILFRNLLRYELRELEHERIRLEEMKPLLPFGLAVAGLHESRRRLEELEPSVIASRLMELTEELEETRETIEAQLEADEADEGDRTEDSGGASTIEPAVANRAARTVDTLRRTLDRWYRFHEGYDPLFTWWVEKPHQALDRELESYAEFVRRRLVDIEAEEEEDAIIGDPIGRDALLSELEVEMIPYTPEELIAIAEDEYAWCLEEMRRASRELGFGDDWKAALDHVKSLHVDPGEQPRLIRDLAQEAVAFLEARDLMTIPELCKETWRMEMMSPQRQKVSPYFLGGETIIVSFPTDAMDHADKLMSMRGNNIHFSRATVHHELIPGHHLQGFMTRRYRTHRRIFATPFWGEGWALYWEMLLWDLGFAQTPENRVGMLFWRMHRCARIKFSLGFHLEQMTAQEAIDYLVENVGHEVNNATAEVRRSVSGDYGPLYQAAYMVGGLQLRALHRELVGSGRMSDREFHDAVLRQNSIPIEMVRAALAGQALSRDHTSSWRFHD